MSWRARRCYSSAPLSQVSDVHVVVQTADGVGSPFDDEWVGRVVVAAIGAGGGMVGKSAEVAVLLADDAALHDLNRRFRGIDAATDVLSFQGDASEASRPACAIQHVGDIAISVERARRQAEEYGHSFERELAYLLTHGMLHLVGYDHEDDVEQRRMREAEEHALSRLGLTRG